MDKDIKSLLIKYREGTCTEEEKALVENWIMFGEFTEPKLSDTEIEKELSFVSRDLPVVVKEKSLWPRIAVAASIILCLGLGGYVYLQSQFHQQIVETKPFKNDIDPGSNKAFLTLSDGKKISLTDATNGEIAKQLGIRITKTADGQLIYEMLKGDSKDLPRGLNTIETPKGGQYQVRLPDGTNVWLNAASKLTYPSSFTNHQTRSVELSGEAYFEVAKDRNHPFIVNTISSLGEGRDQQVEVLGTHFNINTYTDETSTKTTLIEGSIKVSQPTTHKSQLLKPGQESIIAGNTIKIQKANIDRAIAWKNGSLKFDNESIEEIMRILSRWYDIDVKYESKPSDEAYYGEISRFKNISQVLRMLEKTNTVHFKVEGRRVIVTK